MAPEAVALTTAIKNAHMTARALQAEVLAIEALLTEPIHAQHAVMRQTVNVLLIEILLVRTHHAIAQAK